MRTRDRSPLFDLNATRALVLATAAGLPLSAWADPAATAPAGSIDKCADYRAKDEFVIIFDAATGRFARPSTVLYGSEEIVVCIEGLDHRDLYQASVTLTDLPKREDPLALIKGQVKNETARVGEERKSPAADQLQAKIKEIRRLILARFDRPLTGPVQGYLDELDRWQQELQVGLTAALQERDAQQQEEAERLRLQPPAPPAPPVQQAPPGKPGAAPHQAPAAPAAPPAPKKPDKPGSPEKPAGTTQFLPGSPPGGGGPAPLPGNGPDGGKAPPQAAADDPTDDVEALQRAIQLLRSHFERSRQNLFRINVDRDKKVELALFRKRYSIVKKDEAKADDLLIELKAGDSERVGYTTLETHSRSYFRINVGVAYTFLKDTGYRLATSAAGQSTIVTDSASPQVLPMLVLSHYWAGTDSLAPCPLSSSDKDHKACPLVNWIPTFAIGIPLNANPFENFFIGALWQPFPGFGFTGGAHIGKIRVLREGFEVGGTPPANVPSFQERDLTTTEFHVSGYVAAVLTSDLFVKVFAKIIK